MEAQKSNSGRMTRRVMLVLVSLCSASVRVASDAKHVKHHHVSLAQAFLYVAADGLYGYATKTDGTLTRINTSYPLTGQFLSAMIASPNGQFLYVCGEATRNNDHDGAVYGYGVAPDGKLAILNAVGAGSLPSLITSHPSGRFLYCVSLDVAKKRNVIFGYSVKHSGTLVPLNNRPTVIPIGPISHSAFALSGHILFLSTNDMVLAFRVSPNGTLHPLPPYSFKTHGGAYVCTNLSGNYAYIASAKDNKLLQFRVSSEGQLVPLVPAEVYVNKAPTSIVLNPNGHFLYVICDAGIAQYRIDSSGKLHSLLRPLLATRPLTGQLVFTKSGQFAYLTVTGGNDPGDIEQFKVKAGSLSSSKHPPLLTGVNPISVAVAQR